MPSADSLTELASLAGRTLVTAVVTDAWEAARKGFARLLGRGDPDQVRRIERRQDETRSLLTGPAGTDRDLAYATLEAQWVTRLGDLLEEDPNAEVDLRALVEEIRAVGAHVIPQGF